MNRWRVWLLPVVVGLLAGCTAQIPTDPYPYSFTDPDKEIYPCTIAGAERFISDSRPPRWTFQNNSYVKAPEDSARTLRGDCDDFATMMAFYLQEYWGYDTFIVLLDNIVPGRPDHALCFVDAPTGLIDPGTCYNYPYIVFQGVNYDPVDWTACPGWTWVDYGGTIDFEPFRCFENWLTHDWICFYQGEPIEWYEFVNLLLTYLPTPPSTNSLDDPLECPTSISDKCLTQGCILCP